MNILRKAFKTTEVFLEVNIKAVRSVMSGAVFKKWRPCKKKVLIIANGPSLNHIDISRFLNGAYDIACVNNYPFQHKEFWTIKPRYLILVDPVYYKERPGTADIKNKLIAALEQVSWELLIVAPYGSGLDVKNQHIRYEWIGRDHIAGAEVLKKYRFSLYKKRILHMGHINVVIAALYYFITNGAGKIYIAGLDMTEYKCLTVDENNDIWVESVHSYGTEWKRFMDYGILQRGELYKLLEMYALMFREFHEVSEYAKEMKAQIVNLNPESQVDVLAKSSRFYHWTGQRKKQSETRIRAMMIV